MRFIFALDFFPNSTMACCKRLFSAMRCSRTLKYAVLRFSKKNLFPYALASYERSLFILPAIVLSITVLSTTSCALLKDNKNSYLNAKSGVPLNLPAGLDRSYVLRDSKPIPELSAAQSLPDYALPRRPQRILSEEEIQQEKALQQQKQMDADIRYRLIF